MSKFGDLVNAEVSVLVFFYTKWNDAAAHMESIVHELANVRGGNLRVVKIDVAKNNELVEALRIKQVPTMMFYKDGAMVWRQSGIVDYEALIQVTQTL